MSAFRKPIIETTSFEDLARKATAAFMSANPDKVQQALLKPSLQGWFVGQVLRFMRGKASEAQVKPIVEEAFAFAATPIPQVADGAPSRNAPSVSNRDAIRLEISPADWMPAPGAYAAGPTFSNPAKILLSIPSIMQLVDEGDLAPEDVWRTVMDTIVHEVGHAIEHAVGLEFSEDRVEGYVERYRDQMREASKGMVLCPDCEGHGFHGGTACRMCHGSARVPAEGAAA